MIKKIASLFLSIIVSVSGFSQLLNHQLNVHVNIEGKSLIISDEVHLSKDFLNKIDTLSFHLNDAFNITLINDNYTLKEVNTPHNSLKKYIIEKIKPDDDVVLTLNYVGIIDNQIKSDNVTQGVSKTSGIISDNGVYLNGSTYWVPSFGTELFTFNMTVQIDKEWDVVSQGTRTINDINGEKKKVTYNAINPMQEIFLIASKWSEFNYQADDVLVQAFLGDDDKQLANKYLKTTEHYLKIYEQLIGTYPYSKFALVENYWESGYGMPSFTLLGKKIIRLPFILHSSYPHELLHNWWGNSVYIDYSKGNWSEGLTAYMADHLIKEQQGQGVKYRRTALEKFTNKVNIKNDFPIRDFRSRKNATHAAIGYEKVMMVNEMLRYMLGDKIFVDSYARFYEKFKFKKASFDDIQKTFEEVSGSNLQPFFYQWILRPGAPSLKLSDVTVNKEAEKYNLTFKLSQVQEEDPFLLFIPIAVYFEGKEPKLIQIGSGRREKEFSINFDNKPLKIEVDPQINVFRRLDENEIPPKLSLLLKSKEVMLVLPKKSEHFEAYKTLALTWEKMQKMKGNKLIITTDEELKNINKDIPVWILGYKNKFANKHIVKNHFEGFVSENEVSTVDQLINTGSLVYVYLNRERNNQLTGFIGSNNSNAIKAMSRKLNYYGSYSYMGFVGDESKDVLKGIFPPLNSPLSHVIKYSKKTPIINTKLKPRKALAY
jgi:hypothetical protein